MHEEVSRADALPHRLPARRSRGVVASEHTRFDPDDASHPIEPYIVMVADAYDAMTSTRSYRKALPQDVAFAELRDKAGEPVPPRVCRGADPRPRDGSARRTGPTKRTLEPHWDITPPEAGVGSAGLGDLLPDEAAERGR